MAKITIDPVTGKLIVESKENKKDEDESALYSIGRTIRELLGSTVDEGGKATPLTPDEVRSAREKSIGRGPLNPPTSQGEIDFVSGLSNITKPDYRSRENIPYKQQGFPDRQTTEDEVVEDLELPPMDTSTAPTLQQKLQTGPQKREKSVVPNAAGVASVGQMPQGEEAGLVDVQAQTNPYRDFLDDEASGFINMRYRMALNRLSMDSTDLAMPDEPSDSLLSDEDWKLSGRTKGETDDEGFWEKLAKGVGRGALEAVRPFVGFALNPIEEGVLSYGFGIDDKYNPITQNRLAVQRQIKEAKLEQWKDRISAKATLNNIMTQQIQADVDVNRMYIDNMKIAAGEAMWKYTQGIPLDSKDEKAIYIATGHTPEQNKRMAEIDPDLAEIQYNTYKLNHEMSQFRFDRDKLLMKALGGATVAENQFAYQMLEQLVPMSNNLDSPTARDLMNKIGILTGTRPDAEFVRDYAQASMGLRGFGQRATQDYGDRIEKAYTEIDKAVQERMKPYYESQSNDMLQVPKEYKGHSEEYLTVLRNRISAEEESSSMLLRAAKSGLYDLQSVYAPARTMYDGVSNPNISATSKLRYVGTLNSLSGDSSSFYRPGKVDDYTIGKFGTMKTFTPIRKEVIEPFKNGLNLKTSADGVKVDAAIEEALRYVIIPDVGGMTINQYFKSQTDMGEEVTWNPAWNRYLIDALRTSPMLQEYLVK